MKMSRLLVVFLVFFVSCICAMALAQGTTTEDKPDITPFLGKWEGTWSYKSSSTSSGSYPVELTVRSENNQDRVTWNSAPGRGAVSPWFGEYPAKLQKRDGITYLSFTTNGGSNIEFHPEKEKLVGGNTSARWDSRCELTRAMK